MKINKSPVMYKQTNTLSLNFSYRYSLYHDQYQFSVLITNHGIESHGAAGPQWEHRKYRVPHIYAFILTQQRFFIYWVPKIP